MVFVRPPLSASGPRPGLDEVRVSVGRSTSIDHPTRLWLPAMTALVVSLLPTMSEAGVLPPLWIRRLLETIELDRVKVVPCLTRMPAPYLVLPSFFRCCR